MGQNAPNFSMEYILLSTIRSELGRWQKDLAELYYFADAMGLHLNISKFQVVITKTDPLLRFVIKLNNRFENKWITYGELHFEIEEEDRGEVEMVSLLKNFMNYVIIYLIRLHSLK